MNDHSNSRRRMIWIIPPIALGVFIFMWIAGGKQSPTRAERSEPIRSVRVVVAQEIDLVPVAEGYGAVQPDRIWTAVAQVAGRIIHVHPRLRNGEILLKDTVLFRIDPVDYELNLAQIRAELAELDVQEQNTRASLDIEQRNLAVAQRELKRLQNLAKKGTASQSDADSAERIMLSTRTTVQNAKNLLALIPSQRALLEAKASQAMRDLEHTAIKAPFNLRIANLQIETDQYVAKAQTLFQGDDVDRVEIVAQVAMASLRRLFIGRDINVSDAIKMNQNLADIAAMRPLVRLDIGNHIAEWEAQFVRITDNVDPQTRTIGVVVAVDKPFDKIIPGYRPPLSKGMFVQVVLRGKTQPKRVVVPRSAIRGGTLYLADDNDRLQPRPVDILFNQGIISIIRSGVEPGQRIVVSDLVPAVTGMLLKAEIDSELTAKLSAAGQGEL